MTSPKERASRLAAGSQRSYLSPRERAALRCALGDAAHLCDEIMRSIQEANTTRGRVTNAGVELADVAKRCGDAIWAMRDLIKVRDEDAA